MTSGSIIISAKHSLSHGQAGISFGLANMEISSAQYNKAQLWPTAREQSTDRREGRGARKTKPPDSRLEVGSGGRERRHRRHQPPPPHRRCRPTHACFLGRSCPAPLFRFLSSAYSVQPRLLLRAFGNRVPHLFLCLESSYQGFVPIGLWCDYNMYCTEKP